RQAGCLSKIDQCSRSRRRAFLPALQNSPPCGGECRRRRRIHPKSFLLRLPRASRPPIRARSEWRCGGFHSNSEAWQKVYKEIYHLEGVSGKLVSQHPETKRMIADINSGHISALIFSKLDESARPAAPPRKAGSHPCL